MRDDIRDGLALLILRLGLAWFIFLWAVHKIITPGQYQGLARHFDGVELEFSTIYLVAAAQISICGLVALGGLRRYTADPVNTQRAMQFPTFRFSHRWLNEQGGKYFERHKRGLRAERHFSCCGIESGCRSSTIHQEYPNKTWW
jgi:hypothetical protein